MMGENNDSTKWTYLCLLLARRREKCFIWKGVNSWQDEQTNCSSKPVFETYNKPVPLKPARDCGLPPPSFIMSSFVPPRRTNIWKKILILY